MLVWIKSLSQFPEGADAWKLFIPALIPALALVASVWIAVGGWKNAEEAKRREARLHLAAEAAVACGEAFERLYDATMALKEPSFTTKPPGRPTMDEAATVLAEPKQKMLNAYRTYRRTLVRLGTLADLGDLQVTYFPAANDGLLEQFDRIAWNATTRFSLDEAESKFSERRFSDDLSETQDRPGFLSIYRRKLETRLNQIMIGEYQLPSR